MVDSGWGIRIFEANEYSDDATIDFFSNFKKTKSRQLDTIITFSGMYGIDNYLIWHLHKDLPNYDFSTVALDVNIFMYKSTDIVSFQDFYRVQDIRYNAVKSQYTVYAISESTVRLRAKLVGYNIISLSYKENRTAKQILEEVLQKNNIFYVVFHDDNNATKNMLHYEYRYFDIDPEWTVLDFIEYIADDNQYEWCIDTFVSKATNKPYYILHIGHELKADLFLNASKPLGIEIDNVSESLYSMKITTNSSIMQPLSNWEGTHKCVWSKHTAGKGGGISKGCFVPTGLGHFNKHLYLRTLEGKVERVIGSSMLNRRKVRIPSIGIGNILKDEGNEYIDEVSLQKNPHTYTIREPHNIIINRGDDLTVQHQLERATRSTPYLDHEAGLFFPSPKLENSPPNSLIFNVDGKRESAVVGGYVYGDGRTDENGEKTLVLPFKEKRGDFRLQFPNGWCLYVDENGDTQLLARDTDPTIKPDIDAPNQEAIEIVTKKEGVPSQIRLFCEDDNYISIMGPLNSTNNLTNINNSGAVWINAGEKIQITTGVMLKNYIIIGVSGGAEPGIKIITDSTDPIDISADSGTITINTTGIVNIGANASAVNLAGGAKAFPLKDHTHPLNCKPGPPANTQKSIDDNTTKTKAT